MPQTENASTRLRQGKEIILKRWQELARQEISAASHQEIRQLRDALPFFLDHLVVALSPKTPQTDANQGNQVAEEHGAQRLSLDDYSLSEVLYDYKLLRRVILEYLESKNFLEKKERDIILNSVEQAMINAGTEFARLENLKYKASLEQTEESNIALEHFASIAAHDLKAPLSTISSFIELIHTELSDQLTPNSAKHIGFIKEASQRMRNLIDRLLEYALLSRTPATFNMVDMNKVLKSVRDNLSSVIEKQNAKIHCDNLPSVRGDNILLCQLMQNLISNSLKFSGGKTPEITVTAKINDHEFLFSVKDNGIGFDSKYKEEVFSLYRKLHESTQGTGIGLASCRKVIDIHRGKIWVESEPGKGATFYFTIPKF